MAVNIHITIIELNALHTKRQNLFQELDAVIHLLMEAKHWGLRKSRNATSLNSRFKSLDTLKVKIISVTFRRVIRTNHLWFVLITLLNVTLIILTLSVSRLLNLLLRLVAFLLFLNPQCLASISRWITASSSWKRFCLFVCRALSSIMVICMLTAIRLLLTFVMSLYLLLRS